MANDEAADTSNLNAMSAGMAMPVGTSNGPPNRSSEVEGEGENGEKDKRASGIADPSLDNNGGDEDIHHTYFVPNSTQLAPYPDEPRPPPLSMSLEGEISVNHHTTDMDTARREASGEGQGMAMSHREAAGGRDKVGEGNDGQEMLCRVEETPNEVKGSDNAASTLHGVDNKQSQMGEAKDEMRGDEEDDVNSARTCKTATQRCADAVHDPDGQTDSPDSVPPSPPSRHPVGTMDGDKCCPSEPTEPPDKKEGEQGGNSELRRVEVEHIKGVEDVELSQDEETSQEAEGAMEPR
ncbi:hypothetical protein PAXINDRAFT_17034 [Paxillus involutus ATCC 200175]|uniref:Uncharacterized protein n=1 Tax=Paxillus involutus ATCC 200175 TaxID=664439 RepID=A0A0C9T2K7_PAXIN|nr:hypothetical protein PAXINDRAFT_17034 [Paxillus involutus ATCC 200175]